MSPIATSTPTHIPAWKKLGLKLKYAKQDADGSARSGSPSVDGEGTGRRKKRKIGEDVGFREGLKSNAKRTKISKKAKSKKELHSDVAGLKENSVDDVAGLFDNGADHGSQKRKSVSFTPETKAKDGDSVKQMYKTWLASQRVKRLSQPGDKALSESSAVQSSIPTIEKRGKQGPKSEAPPSPTPRSPDEPKRQKKNKKKAKPKAPTQSEPHSRPSDTASPYLTYLTTHHTSPSTWKFSKKQDHHILQKLFSLTDIPSSYDTALLSYLSGLQNLPARQSIREQALEIIEADSAWLDSTTASPLSDTKANSETKSKEGKATDDSEEADNVNLEPDSDRQARRKAAYQAEVARVKQMLKGREYEREDRLAELNGENEEWDRRFRKRKRAEVVLWAVGEKEKKVKPVVQQQPERRCVPGMNGTIENGVRMGAEGRNYGWMLGKDARKMNGVGQATGKKIVFSDDGEKELSNVARRTANGLVNGSSVNGATHAEGESGERVRQRTKKKKRRGKKRTSLPDDDDTSSSSSSSDDGGDEGKQPPEVALVKVVQKKQQQRAIQEESDEPTSSSGSDDSE